jgi:hypothetical protein
MQLAHILKCRKLSSIMESNDACIFCTELFYVPMPCKNLSCCKLASMVQILLQELYFAGCLPFDFGELFQSSLITLCFCQKYCSWNDFSRHKTKIKYIKT